MSKLAEGLRSCAQTMGEAREKMSEFSKAVDRLQERKLEFYRERLGAMTSAEALQLAIEAEQTKNDVGPFDTAFEYFANQQVVFEKYEHLLEEEVSRGKA